MADKQESFIENVSRSIGQYCDQMSFINVTVPKFEEYQNVFDFINEYEVLTCTLNNLQKISLLVKAFKRGRTRCWFETELAPLIERQETWEVIKRKIISRFSDTEDRDRHFKRLRDIKFEASKSLLDFVEEIIYSYRKAYPTDVGDDNCIKFVKASIPDDIRSKLNLEQDYRSSNTIERFKDVIKRFDAGLSFSNSSNSKSDNQELKAMMKQLFSKIESMDKEHKATRDAVNAAYIHGNKDYQYYMQKAFYSDRDSSRPRRNSDARTRYSSGDRRDPTKSPKHSRSSTPERNNRDSDDSQSSDNYRRKRDNPSTKRYTKRSNERRNSRSSRFDDKGSDKPVPDQARAFNDDIYYQKFGKPPSPCTNCDAWHWARHCPKDHLK